MTLEFVIWIRVEKCWIDNRQGQAGYLISIWFAKKTSERRVVDDHEDYEGGVEDGECYEQLVEGVAHLLARQDRHRQYISGKTHSSDKRHQDSLDNEKLNGMQFVQSYCGH